LTPEKLTSAKTRPLSRAQREALRVIEERKYVSKKAKAVKASKARWIEEKKERLNVGKMGPVKVNIEDYIREEKELEYYKG